MTRKEMTNALVSLVTEAQNLGHNVVLLLHPLHIRIYAFDKHQQPLINCMLLDGDDAMYLIIVRDLNKIIATKI